MVNPQIALIKMLNGQWNFKYHTYDYVEWNVECLERKALKCHKYHTVISYLHGHILGSLCSKRKAWLFMFKKKAMHTVIQEWVDYARHSRFQSWHNINYSLLIYNTFQINRSKHKYINITCYKYAHHKKHTQATSVSLNLHWQPLP